MPQNHTMAAIQTGQDSLTFPLQKLKRILRRFCALYCRLTIFLLTPVVVGLSSQETYKEQLPTAQIKIQARSCCSQHTYDIYPRHIVLKHSPDWTIDCPFFKPMLQGKGLVVREGTPDPFFVQFSTRLLVFVSTICNNN